VQTAIQDPVLNSTITLEILALVGDSPPPLMGLSSQEIQNRLKDKTIDIGMCGFFMTQGGDLTRLNNFDFTIHYISSGLQATVPRINTKPNIFGAFAAIIGTIDAKAQLIFVVLNILVIIFGHIFAAAECSAIEDEDVQVRDNYFEGTQDGMWYSYVIMSTVGLGDIVPRTFFGRCFTVGWMFASIALTSMLYAVVATNFSNLELIPSRAIPVADPSDLAPYQLGTALAFAANVLTSLVPKAKVSKFPTNAQPDVFRSLINGSIDVAVERPETVEYYNRKDPEFLGRLLPVGPVFSPEGVAFGVKRLSASQPHPLLRLLSLSVAEASRTDYTDFQDMYGRWFGTATGDTSSNSELRHELEYGAIVDLKDQAFMVLITVGCLWLGVSAVTVLRRLAAFKAMNHTCGAVRKLLNIPEQVGHGDREVGLRERRRGA
jgi:ABC-type amino acid transport substrate-binding protein